MSYLRYGVKIGYASTLKDSALIMHNLTESDIVYIQKKILELKMDFWEELWALSLTT